MKNTKFYQGWVKLINDLKPMTWPKRFEHLWEYYKEYLWIAAVAAIFLAAMIAGIINVNKETVVRGMLVNIAIDQEGYDYLSEDYGEKLELTGNQEVALTYTNFKSLEDPTSTEDNAYASMAVVNEVSARILDYIILDQMSMEYYLNMGVYMDLEEFFTEEELATIPQEWLIYAREEGSEETWLAAIDISELAFVKDNVTSEGATYFALSGSTQRPEACRAIWEYIQAWEAETAE